MEVTSNRFFHQAATYSTRSNGYLNEEVNMALTAQEIFVETVRFLSPCYASDKTGLLCCFAKL